MENKPYFGSSVRDRQTESGRAGSARRTSPSHVRSTSAAQPGRSSRPEGTPRSKAQGRPENSNTRYSPSGMEPNGGVRVRSDGRYGPPPSRRRRKKDPLARIIPLVLIVAALILLINLASAWLVSTTNQSTYCDNIYVNGIEISAYGKEEGTAYVQSVLDERLHTTYTLTGSGHSWSFSAADFDGQFVIGSIMERAWNLGHVGNIFDRKKTISSLKDNPIHLEATLTYDESLIDAFVEEIYQGVYVAPQNANVTIDLDKPYLTSESARGQELDRETARAQIMDLIEHGEGSQELPMILLDPELTTEAAMSTLDLIVEYSTDVSFRAYDSRYNVRKGLLSFQGRELHPGETFDFNEIVGPRTQERGWKSAPEYVSGVVQDGYGGGICQASSTLYGAMLKAGMTIIERHPHSMTVSYVEPSIDAAVTDSSKNLVFRNDTDSSIFIFTEVTTETAMVRVYGKRPAYRYELLSVRVREDSAALKTKYIPDTTGKYVYYENETVLYKKGIAACSSEGWLIAYDWDSGVEVSRKQLSFDIYGSGTDIYWRGIHPLDETTAAIF